MERGSRELRLDTAALFKICEKIFIQYGVWPKDAATIADCLITADLRGVTSHGVVRIKSYLERAARENWNPRPRIAVTQNRAVCMVDGDDGFGAIVGTAAMQKAMEAASEYGIGICSVRHSSHFGMASYYSLMAAKENMIGFCCSNGVSNLAPYGAKEGMLGTSPFAIAVPVKDRGPIALDISCSVTARGKITNARREGRDIPLGWALDRAGNQTTNPAEALMAGALLPFGGYKGSGISIMIDVLCGVLNGGATSRHVREDPAVGPNVGHTFIAMDISAFQPVEEFKARTLKLFEELKSAAPAPGVEEVLIPGEQAAARQEYNREHGIKVEEGAFAELKEVCAAYALSEELENSIK